MMNKDRVNKAKAVLNLCMKTEGQLLKELPKILKSFGYRPHVTKEYIYAIGETPVLLTAHMDTVHRDLPTYANTFTNAEYSVLQSNVGIGGDDRCGIYIIMELLRLGHRPHVLFTTGEEIGGIGANAFCCDYETLDVNALIAFDRKGETDCVRYNDDNLELTELAEKYGFKRNVGSFSDISIIAPHMGISAVNLSSGFTSAHWLHEKIDISAMDTIIEKVNRMLKDKALENRFYYEDNWQDYRVYDRWDNVCYFPLGFGEDDEVETHNRPQLHTLSDKDLKELRYDSYEDCEDYAGDCTNCPSKNIRNGIVECISEEITEILILRAETQNKE